MHITLRAVLVFALVLGAPLVRGHHAFAAKPAADDSDDEEEKPAPKPKKGAAKPSADRPFASQGYLQVPENHDVRMGDPNGGLAIVALAGSMIRRQEKALNLEHGKMGISMKAGGKAAFRVMAGTVVAETAGGKLVLDRTGPGTRLQVLEGKVLVTGAGKDPKTLYTGQQLDISAGGKVKAGNVPSEDARAGRAWLGSK